jgi:hypothetical protein
LIEKIIADCSEKLETAGRVTDAMVEEMRSDKREVARIYCTRLFTAVAAERLSHKDYMSIDHGNPTLKASQILLGH